MIITFYLTNSNKPDSS
ncbi:hypothetical protein EAE98_007251 [Botrytis deweyae]|uniref:Uncharacterized protein n=1 Tax=Botrytis deweyae TaxID=2478750 RepID=A0ABQ7IIY4_9HELO|nr:hypothetical protein EAE98_007251 [Botrytis deweyae]